jgi:hypothetical protein
VFFAGVSKPPLTKIILLTCGLDTPFAKFAQGYSTTSENKKSKRKPFIMMIIMHPGATKEQIDGVIAEIEKQKLTSHPIIGVEQTIIGAVGDGHYVAKEIFEALPGVMEVQRISKPYKLASRQFHEQDSIFELDGFTVGGTEVPIMNCASFREVFDLVDSKTAQVLVKHGIILGMSGPLEQWVARWYLHRHQPPFGEQVDTIGINDQRHATRRHRNWGSAGPATSGKEAIDAKVLAHLLGEVWLGCDVELGFYRDPLTMYAYEIVRPPRTLPTNAAPAFFIDAGTAILDLLQEIVD